MSRGENLISKHKVKVAGLIILIAIASAMLIIINYANLKITSAVRAYVNGESQYSKAQKDASRALTLFLYTAETKYWDEFERELNVPIGDSLARTAMIMENDDSVIKKSLLQGRNKAEDLDEMIWLFNTFKNVSFMRDAVGIWKKADGIVGQLSVIGDEVRETINKQQLSEARKTALIDEINYLSAELTLLEIAFSESLINAGRGIDTYLFITNTILTILIIGTITAYILLMIRRLRETNVDLILINQELDKFVYSASHDLRAPISSMKGLITLVSTEKDPQEVKHYLKLMVFTLNKQDQFIKEIIDYSRNKKTRVDKVPVSLGSIFSQVILQHQHMPGAFDIEIRKVIGIDIIQSDQIRLEIVIKNLISNSIKYSDPSKRNKYIDIKTFIKGSDIFIVVEDNGIGIEEQYLDKIFDMFFVTDHTQNGSGLGLYLTKETINKLNGHITAESEKGKGTKFTISLPAK